MRERLEARLQQLKAEFESGQKMLADLEAQKEQLRQTLLRISGAAQVLEELLLEPEDHGNNNGAIAVENADQTNQSEALEHA